MKAALLGGGGLRAPLLARALAASGLGVRELTLFDTDARRLAAIAPVARANAPGLVVRETTDAAEAARGSRFVIAAIRAGGQEARAHDERVCLEAGVLGQETVGAAGAALAMRNIPQVTRLARIVEREAPQAIVINYTNPAGMVTEALRSETSLEVVGICDTPAELAERVAGLLYLDPETCSVGFSGINHLGWLTALHEAKPDPEDPFPPTDRLADLFRDPDRLRRVHRAPLFEPEEMAGAVPSEYVFFHLHPERARERIGAAGTTRGEAILELERRLFPGLRDPQGALAAWREAMDERNSTYLRVEAGAPQERRNEPVSGYDRIGLRVLRARLGSAPAEIVVNTVNRTETGAPAVPELPVQDVVEVPARVGPDGVAPIPQPPLPVGPAALLRRVRSAEREIVRAALAGDPGTAAAALRDHPAGGPAAARVFGRLRLPPAA